jgi:diguanylate cyclase (GGDEF)-like protein
VVEALEHLLEQLRRAVERCGAHAASVYLPTPWNPAMPAILVHVGPDKPLPELATVDAALAFSSSAVAKFDVLAGADRPTGAIVGSQDPAGCLIPIPVLTAMSGPGSLIRDDQVDALPPIRRRSDRSDVPPFAGWVGIRFTAPFDGSRVGEWWTVLELAGALASTYVCLYGLLNDPLTGLPGRGELQGTLRADLYRARTNGLPYSLLFINPVGFDKLNDRLGRRAGDDVLREFVQSLQHLLRRTDALLRYGGAIFALRLGEVTTEAAVLTAEKIRRHISEQAFLNDAVRLRCAVGVVSCSASELTSIEPLDLLRRASEALAGARQDGAARVVVWRAGADGATTGASEADRLLGIFTGQTNRDYRNMRLLWDVLQAISGTSGTADLARRVIDQLFALLKPARAALFLAAKEGPPGLIVGRQRVGAHEESQALTMDEIGVEERRLNEEAIAARTPQQLPPEMTASGEAKGPAAFAIPLLTDGRVLGTLYLLGDDVATLDRTDLPVLAGVAAQLAVALDREQLSEQHRLHSEWERRRLRAELLELRTALQQAKLVYRSKAMADLLATTKRAATTDATVLITGESGTGKELLAETLHQLSKRRAKPFVLVDCGAIPSSLMDSELFGRERGAYTGAERRAPGRLAQADGGTVFLDEIGELPLDVQSKLLRFVQEKTLTMVGATGTQKVNVRIIAATNRDLEEEVRTGRFRHDLFYRLNVLRLRIPPLRERPDDLLFLVRHFLETFALQYQKPLRGLDAAAERLILSYDWPGNVRELQNVVLQAVVLAEGDHLTAGDLSVPTTARPTPTERAAEAAGADANTAPGEDQLVRTALSFNNAWVTLRERLEMEVDAAAGASSKLGPPLGKWLAHDLVLAAHQRTGDITSRAAARIGLPETTFARRLRQAETDVRSSRRSDSWELIRQALESVVEASDRPAGNLADQIESLLLHVIVGRVPDNTAQAAALMGVSVPTMKRRVAALKISREQRSA